MAIKHNRFHPYSPFWVGALFATLTAITIPWNLYLAFKLPPNNLSNHWDVAWVGFDIGLSLAIATTAWLAIIKSKYLIMAATITATMLVMDAWFDVITAHKGYDFIQSMVLAFFCEIPLAFVTYRLAYTILKHDFKGKR